MVIFGSYARNEAGSDSDLDVLIVLEDVSDRYDEYRRVADVVVHFLDCYGVYVSPILLSQKDFETGSSPLLRNVKKEGVTV